MRKLTLTVTAVLAVLLLAVGGAVAHGSTTNVSDQESVPENGTTDEWATWTEQHMTEHMGVDVTAQMQEQMDMSDEEMGEHMASRQDGSMMDGGMMGSMMNGTMSERGCH